MFVATLETGNFDFVAFGNTKTEAIETMRKAWESHAEQFAPVDDFEAWADSVKVQEGEAGQAFRNGWNLITPKDLGEAEHELKKLFAEYLRELRAGNYNDARLLALNLEHHTYITDTNWMAADKRKKATK